MSALVSFTAVAEFAAARHLPSAPDASPQRRVHGHDFRVALQTPLPAGLAPFLGSEPEALELALTEAVAPLAYRDLNGLLENPTDTQLARWICERLALPRIERVHFGSGGHQGVLLDAAGHAHAWRRYRFEAAHFLPNVPAGHKCGRLHGHGFEVVLHAAMPPGADDGVSAHLALDAAWVPVHERLHHRCLNDIPGLENPTAELLTSWIWSTLHPALPALSMVSCFETPSSGAHFDGLDYRIWKEFRFDSAVRLRQASPEDSRARVHGHTYTLRLHLAAPLETLMGWVVDYGDVKRIFEPLYRQLDHHPLHEREALANGDVASIAQWIHDAARPALRALRCVDLEERPGCGVVLDWGAGGGARP